MRKSFFYLLFTVVVISCVPQKKIVYLQTQKNNNVASHQTAKKRDTRIEPGDQLYITFNSLDQVGYNPFKQENSSTTQLSESALSVISYTVNDSGYVFLPFIGSIKVQDCSLDESAIIMQQTCKNILNNPAVSVHYVNNSWTILGEVQRPGTYTYAKNQLNVFKAIGLAGDITEYGNRRKVVLIREQGDTIHKYNLDLTRNDIVASEFYYLKPNDIIYVEPLRIRRLGIRQFNDLPINLVFTGMTTVVTTYLLYRSLRK